jgi:Family of unknown function (DUF5677)
MPDDFAKHLVEAQGSFGAIVDFGMRISLALNGQPASEQSALASILHTKMCINGTTLQHIFKASLTDHSSVIALCRMLMEGAIFYQYLMQPVEADEWACRVLCLRLHDTTNRIKLMRGFQEPSDHADLREGREELSRKLEENSHFNSLSQERKKALLTGEHFYIRGVSSAIAATGWNAKKYLAWYAYFSSHAHSAPMSFFRFREQKIRFSEPSDTQLAAMVTALSVAEYSLLKASLIHLNTAPQCLTKFNATELSEMKRTLKSCKKRFEN